MNFKSFYWMIYSQFCRPEMGISHQELKNPDQMRKDVCDHFFKKHQDGDPYVHRIINEHTGACNGKSSDARLGTPKKLSRFKHAVS